MYYTHTHRIHLEFLGVLQSKHKSHRVGKQQTRGLFSAASDTHPPTWSLIDHCWFLNLCSFQIFAIQYNQIPSMAPKEWFPKRQWDKPKPLSFAPPVPRCGIHNALIYRPGASLCLANWLGFCFSFFTMASRRGENYREKLRLALTTFEQAWCVSQKPQYT